MEKRIVTTRNGYGIRIVKCCASCRYKKCDNRMRLCIKGEGAVPPDFLCPEWEMSECLSLAGKGGGVVKKKAYLHYSVDTLLDENRKLTEASAARRSYMRKSKEEIRSEFAKTEGTIYEEGL